MLDLCIPRDTLKVQRPCLYGSCLGGASSSLVQATSYLKLKTRSCDIRIRLEKLALNGSN